jgi:lipopolysaccharide/colanic/teichoic acid biosynthesis glycosyltransferase
MTDGSFQKFGLSERGGYQKSRLIKVLELPIIIAGGMMPALMVWSFLDREYFTGAFEETIIFLIISIITIWYILSRLKDHANARHLSYVVPVNVVVFTCYFSAMALLRIDYSGSLFATGAASSVVASFLVAVYGRRSINPILVVMGGRSSEIELIEHYMPAPSLSDMEALISSGRKDWSIVADLHYLHSERAERLFASAALAGVPVYHYRQIAEMQSGQVKISHLSENDLGSLIPNVSYVSIKRIIDIILSILLLPLCVPVFLVVGLIIKIDSPGDVFFIQERIGFRGLRFKMLKFRTMREREVGSDNNAKREDAMTKSDDNRITRIGRFLRKSRLDELPQIVNVLAGDMSFIGPRPEASALSEWYNDELPFYSYRHIVRPGITGWAQVNQGHVTDVSDVLSKLRYDFYYIKNLSLWLDLLIILKTMRVIVTGVGAK